MENSRMFPEFYQSVMSKAIKVSPTVTGVTIGPNATTNSNQLLDETINDQSNSSTPKKSVRRLSEMTLRRPKRQSIYCEANSSSELAKKTLMAEMAKKQQSDANEKVIQLELNVKEHEKKLQNDLNQAFTKMRLHDEVQKRIAEENLLKKFVLPTALDRESEQVTDSKFLERSEKVKQNVEDAKRKSAALHEKRKIIDQLSIWYKKYVNEYMRVGEILKNCHDVNALSEIASPYLTKLEKDFEITDILRNKLSTHNINSSDLKCAEDLMKNLVTIANVLEVESKAINDAIAQKELKDAEDRVKEAEERARKAEERVREEEENKHVKESNTFEASTFLDMESLQSFLRYTKLLSEVHTKLEIFVNDSTFNQFRFELQKAVTLPVNAISPVNAAHMLDKYRKLHTLLSGKPIDIGKVAAETHPLGVLYIKDLLAKLFVRQGEMSGSSKPESVFALASILVNLWVDFPDFGELVLAHFYKRCPYLAPVFLPQVEGQSDQDYYRSLGYLISKGEIEKQDMFLKRMKGLMRLFAAILISKPRNSSKANPLGLAESWRWLAAILNLEPRPDICPVLIMELLEVAGHDMLLVYRGQMRKILAYLMSEYFTRLDQVTASSSRGPLTRLETFLATAAKNGGIPEPAQRLSHSFW